MNRLLAAALSVLAPGLPVQVQAQTPVHLTSNLFVERERQEAGLSRLALEPASQLEAGDRVVLLVDWNTPRGGPFTLTSALPAGLMFQRSSKDEVEVSADGGLRWGRLGSLRIRDSRGDRLVAPEDVTHLRIRVPASEAAQGRGRISYRAIVR